MGEGELLFKVTEPSGKVYRIFTDGTIEGFAEGSWLVNRYPGLLRFNIAARAAYDQRIQPLGPP